MKEITLVCRNGDKKPLLAHLTGQVFHLTTQSAYRAILSTGKILHNKDGQFKLNTCSDHSFGRLMGYVCLFDLANDYGDIQDVLDCYYFLGPNWFAKQRNRWMVSELAYLLLSPDYYDRIISNSRWHDHVKATEKYLHFIPRAEVWINDHVPIKWIEAVILVNITKPVPGPNTLAGILHRVGPKRFTPNK